MSPTRATRRRALLLGFALAAGALAVPATHAATGAAPTASAVDTVSLVRVDTPSRADKDRLLTLGLDLTEHAGEDFVEVVLHGAADAQVLREAGLDFAVEIADLADRGRERARLDAAYAARVATSELPSGRTGYRSLADYEQEMADLAKTYPTLVKPLELPHETIEGRTVHGIEITEQVAAQDGKPVFLLMGLHHAREWPSGEHALEFAYDLVQGYGSDKRTTDLLRRTRVVVVPVVNADGFHDSFTGGSVIDLRAVDDGGTVSILGTPGAAYKRKNCRPADGVTSIPQGTCPLSVSQGGFGNGVDLNRNYGGLWGGPGADAQPAGATYRGEGPFSEPETRNIQHLMSTRQVTTMITNHTFSNLVLRPPGVRAQGAPPDEKVYEALGARMSRHNGYVNQPSYALYDTTGTTEDWSYYATGGLGFTFEIGEEFHPPYERVVQHYVGGTEGEDRGAGDFVDMGNREAYFEALAATADPALHSVLAGKAPAGATLRLVKEFPTLTSPVVSPTGSTGPRQALLDRLETMLKVGRDGRFEWHVNPSTRPAVMARRLQVLDDPLHTESFAGGPTVPIVGHVDHEFEVTDSGVQAVQVDLTWPTPDDMDLEVYRKKDGELHKVGSSGGFVFAKEQVFLEDVSPGSYVARVINFASATPTYQVDVAQFGAAKTEVTTGLVEQWTLICEVGGVERSRSLVTVERGQQQKLRGVCGKR
ncbi:MAG: M14 family metallopeptidase [Mycobacteriales bacterium]